MSANVFKMTLDKIVGPNGNKEFNDLVKIMGCNIGSKFDMEKLQFDRIIIASDKFVVGSKLYELLELFT